MSHDLNLCQFIGRLGKDPETRYTPDGTAVSTFPLAVGWKSRDKDGTEWVRCVSFGKLAEIVGQYLHKGKQCYVSGRLNTRKYQDKDGIDRYSTEVNLERMQLLGSKDDRDGPPTSKPAAASASAEYEDDGSDIPF